ncbi:hypothetical protein MMC25_001491 [Agyrium rufum]|nr:hypothetical protein [Agyrium rufum]
MVGPLATVGIISIGDMGLGIAKLLVAYDYKVVTSLTGRSEETRKRALAASVVPLETDEELYVQSDYILSIVPPRNAIATAKRFSSLPHSSLDRTTTSSHPLFYIDLNAVAPSTAETIASLFEPTPIKFLDGGIIGGPPNGFGSEAPHGTSSASSDDTQHEEKWCKPSLVTSGPSPLSSAPVSGAHLASILNLKHIASTIGPGSGLKMCFASTSKGLTALLIQSFTTAAALGVLPELQDHLAAYAPAIGKHAEGSLPAMGPKAYRWVAEMREIAKTMDEVAGWDRKLIYEGVAKVYETVAEETVVGKEKVGERIGRGREAAAEVAGLIVEGRKEARGKREGKGKEEDLVEK